MTNGTQNTGDDYKIQILNPKFMVVGWQTNQLMDREQNRQKVIYAENTMKQK